MKKIFLLITLVNTIVCLGQNKPVLYNFKAIPQSLNLNPSIQPEHKFHIGIPVLSGLSFQLGSSAINVADLFRDNEVNFNTKIDNAINNIGTRDYISINQQIEILSGSYRLNKTDFISGGFYTELDVFVNLPKDVIELYIDGNASNINRSFLLSQVSTKADFIGVLHAGFSRKMNERFTLGGRFKIYSGVANVTSTGNTGSFSTRQGLDNIYTHYLNNVNFSGYSSGLYNTDDEAALEVGSAIGRTFLGGNLGLGFDIGFTFTPDSQTEITASILDIGYIKYSKDNRNIHVSGNHSFSGIEFQNDGNNNNYWEDITSELEENVPNIEDREAYSVMRPIKINGSYTYSWGKSRNEESCYDMSYKNYFNNAIGAQLFSVFRPTGPKFALTGFYQTKVSEFLSTKLTYTVDDFSATNIGLGASLKIGKFHVYGTANNLFGLTDVASANIAGFQFGMNLIF